MLILDAFHQNALACCTEPGLQHHWGQFRSAPHHWSLHNNPVFPCSATPKAGSPTALPRAGLQYFLAKKPHCKTSFHLDLQFQQVSYGSWTYMGVLTSGSQTFRSNTGGGKYWFQKKNKYTTKNTTTHKDTKTWFGSWHRQMSYTPAHFPLHTLPGCTAMTRKAKTPTASSCSVVLNHAEAETGNQGESKQSHLSWLQEQATQKASLRNTKKIIPSPTSSPNQTQLFQH